MSTVVANAIHRLRHGLAVPPIEIVYASHSRWPVPRAINSPSQLDIAVLDSSFNPPTLAHLALANHPRPSNQNDYDAKLLLLSITNADKKLKSTDATYEQRVEMMIQLAQDISPGNIAIALIDEPTFVGKSKVLREFLQIKREGISDPKLTFLLGFDTLERFFAPKYYSPGGMHSALQKFFASPPEGDGSSVVCATRSPESYPSSGSSAPEQQLMDTIADFFKNSSIPDSRVRVLDIGDDVKAISSSAVRQAVACDGDWTRMVTEKVRDYVLKERPYFS